MNMSFQLPDGVSALTAENFQASASQFQTPLASLGTFRLGARLSHGSGGSASVPEG